MDINGLTLPDAGTNAKGWIDWCCRRLKEHEKTVAVDPLANSVRRLAHEMVRATGEGALTRETIGEMIRLTAAEALEARSRKFAATHENDALDEALVARILTPLVDADFDTVNRALSDASGGVVFTAHPTFAMSRALRDAVAEYASANSNAAMEDAVRRFHTLRHGPDPEITLASEHAEVRETIDRLNRLLERVSLEILRWAKTAWPDKWRQLAPRPVTVASWVGYDLDGRTDIHWSQTFRFRLEEKAAQLHHYADCLSGLTDENVKAQTTNIRERLIAAARLAEEQAALFAADMSDPANVVAAANRLSADDPARLVTLRPIRQELFALAQDAPEEAAEALLVLCAAMDNAGLGTARIHLRVNAAQVRSALQADFGIDDTRFVDRTAFETAAQKAGETETRKVSMASVFLEKMTARRQFMLCAEFIKHIDGDSPIRFLIAECEAPTTVMGAVYLARLYGVEKQLDISPLFETPEAMERGGRFMERLLNEDEYVRYIRERKRLAIQIGFSDSGRFMGQVSSNMAIERLQIILARTMSEKGLQDVEVLVFNTHGESMGRGAYPGSLKERFDYLITPWTRARYAREGLKIKAESSFQGGDGFLHFATDHLAGATLAGLLDWQFRREAADSGDKFYQDINYSWDFYRGIKNWQENLFEIPDYHVMIGAFGPNLLSVTGSRKARRQSGNVITGPRSLRAIPHNAILQTLAVPANVFGGTGEAAGSEPDKLLEQIEGSARMRQLFGMIREARQLSSLPALRAHATFYDPSFWISKSAQADDRERANACDEIAAQLRGRDVHQAFNNMANHFAADLARLDRILVAWLGEESREVRRDDRRPLHLLHALRGCLVMQGFLLTARIPNFSQRHDVSRSSLFDLAFALQFDELAILVEEIFPADDTTPPEFDQIAEPADGLEGGGYPQIHECIIKPLRDIGDMIREAGIGIGHFYGAHG